MYAGHVFAVCVHMRVEVAEAQTGAGLFQTFAEIGESHSGAEGNAVQQTQIQFGVDVQVAQLDEVHVTAINQFDEGGNFLFTVGNAGKIQQIE